MTFTIGKNVRPFEHFSLTRNTGLAELEISDEYAGSLAESGIARTYPMEARWTEPYQITLTRAQAEALVAAQLEQQRKKAENEALLNKIGGTTIEVTPQPGIEVRP